MTTITITVKTEQGGASIERTISTTQNVDMNEVRLNEAIQNLFAQLKVARDKQK
jgi:hypothetical protein